MSRSYTRTGDRAAPFSADSNKRTAGAYAENTLKLWGGRTVVALGGRFDRITTQTVETPLKTNFTPSESDFTVFNPSFGIKHEVLKNLRAHFAFGRGFIPAEALMLTGYTTTIVGGRTQINQGNPDLRPERSTSFDAGAEWTSRRTRLDITAFRTVVKDRFISNVAISSPPPPDPIVLSVANGLDAHISGLELEADHRVTSRLGVFANTTHYFNRTERLPNGLEQDILNVPAHTIRAGIDADVGPVSARVSGRYVQRPEGQRSQSGRVSDRRLRRLHGDRCDRDVPPRPAARARSCREQPVRRVLLREAGLSAPGRVVQGVLPGGVLTCSAASADITLADMPRGGPSQPLVVASGAQVVASQASATSQSPSNIARGCVGAFEPSRDYFPDKVTVEDAVNFSVTYHRSYKVVSVRDAAGAGPVERYVLVQCGAPAPTLAGELAGAQVATVPISSLYSASPTHLSMLVDLRRLDVLTGVSQMKQLIGEEILERVKSGQVREFAPLSVIDAELVVSQRPGLFMTGGTASAPLAVIRSAGIPVVTNNDWLEPTALARAEWLKFVALFLNEERPAQRLYGEMKTRYKSLSARATAVPDDAKPVVMTGRGTRGDFVIAGGRSYVAALIRDAGGRYVWADNAAAGIGDHRPRSAAPPCGERRHLDQRRWMAEPRHDGQGRAEIRRVQSVSSETGVGLRAAGNAGRRKRLLVPLCVAPRRGARRPGEDLPSESRTRTSVRVVHAGSRPVKVRLS